VECHLAENIYDYLPWIFKYSGDNHSIIDRGDNTSIIDRENCENRNDPDLVQAFLKKWWVESDFKVSKFPAVIITVFITILEQNR
jgi:hypothetical protein